MELVIDGQVRLLVIWGNINTINRDELMEKWGKTRNTIYLFGTAVYKIIFPIKFV
jgi:hypothetical protein